MNQLVVAVTDPPPRLSPPPTTALKSLLGILRREHPQQAHAARLCPSDAVSSWPGARRRRRVDRRREAVHVAAYIEQLGRERSAPTVKQRLAAIRHLFDWLVTGQVMPVNPASSVRGPSHSVKRGKTPVLDPAEARQLIDAIDTTTVIGLRDRALIGLMVYSFARIGAAIGMRVEDAYTQNRRLWVRLHEKGGKQHAMPCHHNLETYLHAYIDGAGLASDPKALLFQTYSRSTGQLTGNPLPQANAYAMIQRRAKAAEITTKIGNHTFRATGVTAYLKNGGTLGTRGADGEPCQHAHDAALRSARRGGDARRGGADTRLKPLPAA